jgi:methylase of polypeptide subunit release factors
MARDRAGVDRARTALPAFGLSGQRAGRGVPGARQLPVRRSDRRRDRKGPIATILDVGAGAGVGGLVAERHAPGAKVYLSDINPAALELARANAAHAGISAEIVLAPGLDGAPADLDLIVANPPYVAGESGRAYKDGGDLHGARLSLDWAIAGMGHWRRAAASSSTPAARSSTAASISFTWL